MKGEKESTDTNGYISSPKILYIKLDTQFIYKEYKTTNFSKILFTSVKRKRVIGKLKR